MRERALINRRELIIILALLLAAIVIYACMSAFGSKAGTAEILYNNEVVAELSLSRNGQYTVDKAPDMIFEVSSGRARVLSSGCPDKICVKTGWLSRPGQSAVCLPNRITLRLRADKNTPDAVI